MSMCEQGNFVGSMWDPSRNVHQALKGFLFLAVEELPLSFASECFCRDGSIRVGRQYSMVVGIRFPVVIDSQTSARSYKCLADTACDIVGANGA